MDVEGDEYVLAIVYVTSAASLDRMTGLVIVRDCGEVVGTADVCREWAIRVRGYLVRAPIEPDKESVWLPRSCIPKEGASKDVYSPRRGRSS